MKFLSLSLLSLALVVSACNSRSTPARTVKVSSTKSGADTKVQKPKVEEDEESLEGDDDFQEDKEEKNTTKPDPQLEEPTTESPKTEVPKPEEPQKEEPKPDDATADCHKGDAFTCQAEKICAEEVNRLRASSGKSALKHDKNIAYVSRDWSRQQAERNSISHDGFPDQRKQVYKSEFNSSSDFWAENCAMFGGSGGDAATVAKKFIDQWWNSPGHKANMLGNYKNIGCGIYKKGNSYYATQLFN